MSPIVKSTLADLCLLVTDGTHDSPKLQTSGVPFIKAKHISNGFVDFENCDFITYEDHLKVIARSKPEKGDTLFTHIGASLGVAAYINRNIEFSIKNVALFKPNPTKIDSRYLYYLVINDSFQNEILKRRTGSAQPFVSLDILRKHEIKYHAEIDTQKKIVTILSAYDDLIENNKRRIEILEEMVRSLYREWFVNFRFPGHEQVKKINSEIGLIPEGWQVVKLGDIARDIRRSVNPEQIDPETPYLGLEHFPRKSIALSEWGTASQVQSTKLIFKKNEILFGRIRPYFHKVGVPPIDGVCSSDVIVIQAKNSEYFSIVLACVSSEEFVNYATQTSQGTKMPRANWDLLIKYPLVNSPGQILQQFNKFVSKIVAQIHNLIFRNKNLNSSRNLLLTKLMSGEIDLEKIDIHTQKYCSLNSNLPTNL